MAAADGAPAGTGAAGAGAADGAAATDGAGGASNARLSAVRRRQREAERQHAHEAPPFAQVHHVSFLIYRTAGYRASGKLGILPARAVRVA
jgi:hypothetical protein